MRFSFPIAFAFIALNIFNVAYAQSVTLNAAVLPNSRAVDIGTSATFFATMSNSGTGNASNCAITLGSTAPAGMAVGYQTTDATNTLTGTANTPVPIAAGASQSFLVSVSSSAAFTGKVPLSFACAEGNAFSFAEVNQPDIRFTAGSGPDIIAIGATLTNDGIAVLDRAANLAAISISAVNIGGASAIASAPSGPKANEAPITVSGQVTGFLTVGNFDVLICETDTLGACKNPLNFAVALNIGDSAKSFSAFLVGDAALGLPFFPSDYRMKITFTDANGNVVGSTSVALNSDAPASAGTEPVGYWEGNIRRNDDFTGQHSSKAVVLIPPDNLPILGYIIQQDPVTNAFLPQVFRMDGQFNPANNTRTGNMLFFDTGNIAGATLPATLSYTPGKQITIAYLGPAADAPEHQGGGTGKPLNESGISNLLNGSGSIGGANPIPNLLGGSGSGSGPEPEKITGNLGGTNGNRTTIDDANVTIDQTTGAVGITSTTCPGTSAETTKFDPNKPPFDSAGLIGMFLSLSGCPPALSNNAGFDGYLQLLNIRAKLKAGKTLNPSEQAYLNVLGLVLGDPRAVASLFLGTSINPQTQSNQHAIMSKLDLPL
jgi:hypothetical protein